MRDAQQECPKLKSHSWMTNMLFLLHNLEIVVDFSELMMVSHYLKCSQEHVSHSAVQMCHPHRHTCTLCPPEPVWHCWDTEHTCKGQIHQSTATWPSSSGASLWQHMGSPSPDLWSVSPVKDIPDKKTPDKINFLIGFSYLYWHLILPCSPPQQGCPEQTWPSSCRTFGWELRPVSPKPERLPLLFDLLSP